MASLPARAIDDATNGILPHGALPSGDVENLLRKQPNVWLMRNRQRPHWGDQVMPDGFEVGHLAARYLVERGHRHLAFLNLDAEHWTFGAYLGDFYDTAINGGATTVALACEQPRPHLWSSLEFVRSQPFNYVKIWREAEVLMIPPTEPGRGGPWRGDTPRLCLIVHRLKLILGLCAIRF